MGMPGVASGIGPNSGGLNMQRREFVGIAAGAVLAVPTMARAAGDKKMLALVTNASADFWTIARRGTEKAAKELPNYDIEMYVVAEATAAEQRRILDDLLTRGVAGVSISSNDPKNSTDILNKVAEHAVLFTTDSDAPESNARSLYRHRQRAGGRAGGRPSQAGPSRRRQDHALRRHDGRRQCP